MDTKHPAITIGGVTFDRVSSDPAADVLYLHVGDPASAVDAWSNRFRIGHALRSIRR